MTITAKTRVQGDTVFVHVSHDLDATLAQVTEAYQQHIAANPLPTVYSQATVHFQFGDADYGDTYSVFEHKLRATA